MKAKIENDNLSVEIACHGAELQSLYNKNQSREYLWQGDEKWWPRKAPVLFPVIGKLKNNEYKIHGHTFPLSQHGFARDKDFALVSRSANSLTFLLGATEESLKVYPFDFDLYIHYMLDQNQLTITYEVLNKDKKEIFFSIGAHPGFNCPLYEDESFSDYYLEFEKEETLDRYLLNQGNFTGETERIMTNTRILELNEELFIKDAIVFKNMNSTFMNLKSKKTEASLKFSFEGFPYFGIWKKPGAPFLCLEPWCGIADYETFKADLNEKEGIVLLGPGEKFVRSYSISV